MKIATQPHRTIWECDRCGSFDQSANAFELPKGWWVAHIERRTDQAGRIKRGTIEACSKECLTGAIIYQNQHLVDYV